MDDETSNNLPPMPWTYQTNSLAGKHPGTGQVYLLDRNGRKIAVLYCGRDEKIALAEFLCAQSEKYAAGS